MCIILLDNTRVQGSSELWRVKELLSYRLAPSGPAPTAVDPTRQNIACEKVGIHMSTGNDHGAVPIIKARKSVRQPDCDGRLGNGGVTVGKNLTPWQDRR